MQTKLIKSFIVLPVLRHSVLRVCESHLRIIAPGKHFNKEYHNYLQFTVFFFSLTRVKCGTLTTGRRYVCDVVVRERICEVSCSDSIRAAFFILFFPDPCIRVRVRAVMPDSEIANQTTKRKRYILQIILLLESRAPSKKCRSNGESLAPLYSN